MIRIYQRIGPGTGMSMPFWLWLLVFPLIAATVGLYYLVKYACIGGEYVVLEVKRRRALRHH